MKTLHFGEISVNKVLDGTESFRAVNAFPNIDLELFSQHKNWVYPFFNYDTKMIILSMHSYLIRTPSISILVDTCIGNDKIRIGQGPIFKANEGVLKHWNNRHSNYIDNLKVHGIHPSEIDIVMCTHLHADHVGWNTKLVNNRWVPTFPNAKYLFSSTEIESMKKETTNPFDEYTRLVYEDSILPIIESGQAVIIDESIDLGTGINLIKSPGHSPGHCCIEVNGYNRKGLLTGDVLHNPIQVVCPGMSTMFCDDKELSNQTRINLVNELTDSETVILAAHFGDTTAGLIESNDQERQFRLI